MSIAFFFFLKTEYILPPKPPLEIADYRLAIRLSVTFGPNTEFVARGFSGVRFESDESDLSFWIAVCCTRARERRTDSDVRFTGYFLVTGRLRRRRIGSAGLPTVCFGEQRTRAPGSGPALLGARAYNVFKSDLEIAGPHVRFVSFNIGLDFRKTSPTNG